MTSVRPSDSKSPGLTTEGVKLRPGHRATLGCYTQDRWDTGDRPRRCGKTGRLTTFLPGDISNDSRDSLALWLLEPTCRDTHPIQHELATPALKATLTVTPLGCSCSQRTVPKGAGLLDGGHRALPAGDYRLSARSWARTEWRSGNGVPPQHARPCQQQSSALLQ